MESKVHSLGLPRFFLLASTLKMEVACFSKNAGIENNQMSICQNNPEDRLEIKCHSHVVSTVLLLHIWEILDLNLMLETGCSV
jgi:hypothetical protein